MELVVFQFDVYEAVREQARRYHREVFVLSTSYERAKEVYYESTTAYDVSVEHLTDAWSSSLEEFKAFIAEKNEYHFIDSDALGFVSFAVGDVVRLRHGTGTEDKYVTLASGLDSYALNGSLRTYKFEDLVLVRRVNRHSLDATRRLLGLVEADAVCDGAA